MLHAPTGAIRQNTLFYLQKREIMKFLYLILFIDMVMIGAKPAGGEPLLTVFWEIEEPVADDLAGFIIYFKGEETAVINDPGAREFKGNFAVAEGVDNFFGVSSFDFSGNKSEPVNINYIYNEAGYILKRMGEFTQELQREIVY